MNPQVIKKGWRRILHLPRLLKRKETYTQRIAVSSSMFKVTDSCDSGWSKLWGISLGHIHWNSSYRFVFRNVKDDGLVIGYYAYIDGVSPQDNKEQKGWFRPDAIEPRDILVMRIIQKGDFMRMHIKNETAGEQYVIDLPAPKKHKWITWLITECYPHLKCKQEQVTTFQFLSE